LEKSLTSQIVVNPSKTFCQKLKPPSPRKRDSSQEPPAVNCFFPAKNGAAFQTSREKPHVCTNHLITTGGNLKVGGPGGKKSL
jgi:hypothetical protein